MSVQKPEFDNTNGLQNIQIGGLTQSQRDKVMAQAMLYFIDNGMASITTPLSVIVGGLGDVNDPTISTDPSTSAATMISLLKGIVQNTQEIEAKVIGDIYVSLDDLETYIGTLADAAVTSPTASASLNSLLKGVLTAVNAGATEATSTAISGKLPSTVGQKTMANSLAVAIASDQSTLNVAVGSLPLPSGAATEATQLLVKDAVETIDNAISGSEMQVDVVASLPTGTNSIGQVTANAGTNLNTSLLALESGGNLSAILTELQLKADLSETQPVSLASLPLPTGAATEATLGKIASDTTAVDVSPTVTTTFTYGNGVIESPTGQVVPVGDVYQIVVADHPTTPTDSYTDTFLYNAGVLVGIARS
jgi:hypothetical protein